MGKLSHYFTVKGCLMCKNRVIIMYMGPKSQKFLAPKSKNELNIVNCLYVKGITHINRSSLISFS